MTGRAFVVLEKDYADQSRRFSFRDFVKQGEAVLMGEHDTHEDAAQWYAEHRADAWEWDEDEPHEYLVGTNSATCLTDLRVVTITKAITVYYRADTKGAYDRRAQPRAC